MFRSGCTFRRGHGKIFFFSPGDQDYPVYHHSDVRRVIANGVAWVKSDRPRALPTLLRYETDDFFTGHGYTGRSSPTRRSRCPHQLSPIRLVQVGAGAMGRAWLSVIGRSTDVRLVGVADLNLDTARRSAADAGFTTVAVATRWRSCWTGSRRTRWSM